MCVFFSLSFTSRMWIYVLTSRAMFGLTKKNSVFYILILYHFKLKSKIHFWFLRFLVFEVSKDQVNH